MSKKMKDEASTGLIITKEQKEVKIEPSDDNYNLCPMCNSRLKRKGIKKYSEEIRQIALCKNKKCKFQREYVFSI
jgi:hypothetical protein